MTETDLGGTLFEGESSALGAAFVVCDFDGDGRDDLAVGAPSKDHLHLHANLGGVYVAYGRVSGATLGDPQYLPQPSSAEDPAQQAGFGESLAAGDFDGDGRCDLAVGEPEQAVGPASSAGNVHVFYGSGGGLMAASQVFSQNTPGIEEVAESTEFFGAVMVGADFDQDGYDDLALAAPGENLLGGVVHVLFGGPSGLDWVGNDLLYPGDGFGTPGLQEPWDRFGASLTAGRFSLSTHPALVVGAPGRNVGGRTDAGAVYVFFPTEEGFVDRFVSNYSKTSFTGLPRRDFDEFGGRLAVGDFDANGYLDLVIGSPDDSGTGEVGSPDNDEVGTVVVAYGSSSGLQISSSDFWTQDSPGIGGAEEGHDRFGDGLAAGDFDGDGYQDLAIGVPKEDFENGGHTDNGAVHAIYGGPGGLSAEGQQFHGRGVWGLGLPRDGDRFGWRLAAGDFDGDGVATLVVDEVGHEENAFFLIHGHRGWLVFMDGFESGQVGAWN